MFDHYLPTSSSLQSLPLPLVVVSPHPGNVSLLLQLLCCCCWCWLCFSLSFTCCLMLVFRTFRAIVAQSRLVFPGLLPSESPRGVELVLSSRPDRLIRDLAYLR